VSNDVDTVRRVNAILAAAEVTRWHTVQTDRNQNLAEHQWLVTMLAVEIMHVAGADHITVGELMGTMTHDMHEIEDGDIPPTESPESIAARINDMNQWKKASKLADLIEAAWFIKNNSSTSRAQYRSISCTAKLWKVIEHMTDRVMAEAAKEVQGVTAAQ